MHLLLAPPRTHTHTPKPQSFGDLGGEGGGGGGLKINYGVGALRTGWCRFEVAEFQGRLHHWRFSFLWRRSLASLSWRCGVPKKQSEAHSEGTIPGSRSSRTLKHRGQFGGRPAGRPLCLGGRSARSRRFIPMSRTRRLQAVTTEKAAG